MDDAGRQATNSKLYDQQEQGTSAKGAVTNYEWLIADDNSQHWRWWGYRGGSPTAVQAWQPCPLWEPSPSHPILL